MIPKDYPSQLKALLFGEGAGIWGNSDGTARVSYTYEADRWTWEVNGRRGHSDMCEDVVAALEEADQ